MSIKIDQANNDVNEIYFQLSDAAKETIGEIVKPIDDIVKELSKGINLFSNTELWDFKLRLGIESYKWANIREQSSLKEAWAEALYKEGLAKSYAEATGAAETKKQASILASIEKQAVSMLYSSISGILKAKLDEAHRLVNILQNIQISRAAEAKLNGSPRSEADGINFQ